MHNRQLAGDGLRGVRIAWILPDDWTAWLFYRDLARALIGSGASLTILAADTGSSLRLTDELQARFVSLPYARFTSPFRDLRLIQSLRREIRSAQFDLVQNFTIKANLYGAAVAASRGVPAIINTVEGAGLLYSEPLSSRVRRIRRLVEPGLRWVKRWVTTYWFVNEHDRTTYIARRLADPEQTIVLTATGVDVAGYDAARVPRDDVRAFKQRFAPTEGLPVLACIAGRLLNSKGIGLFLEVVRRLKTQGLATNAILVGPEEHGNPDAFSPTLLRGAIDSGLVRWTGFLEDVRVAYAAADLVVVPTSYAEGTPKGIMEGMAMGTPIVCSDLPSIRAMIPDRNAAIMVSAGDVSGFTDAVAALLTAPLRRQHMREAARRHAMGTFDSGRLAGEALSRVYLPILAKTMKAQPHTA